MTNIDVYRDARRKLEPVDSLYYVLSDAAEQHQSLKQFFGSVKNLLMGQILQSARILVSCIRDIDDFTKEGIHQATVTFVRENFIRACAHLAFYIGDDTIELFVSEITQTPMLDLAFGPEANKEKQLENLTQ
jgi:hypothetical protein